MLGALVENCGPRFQTSFADPQLVERIKLMSQDPLVDASVRRKLMRMLLSWSIQFKGESTMRHAASLYAACGGGRKSDAQMRSEAAEAYRKRKETEDRERQLRSDQKAAERLQREEEARRAKERKKRGDKRPVFNFEKVCVSQRSQLQFIFPPSFRRNLRSCLHSPPPNNRLQALSMLCNMLIVKQKVYRTTNEYKHI